MSGEMYGGSKSKKYTQSKNYLSQKKKKVVLAYKSDQEQRFTKLLRVVVKKETKNLS